MKEQDKHEWHPAPEIPACASDREILHALLDKLLDNPGEQKVLYEIVSVDGGENGPQTLTRRRFRVSADAWVVKENVE